MVRSSFSKSEALSRVRTDSAEARQATTWKGKRNTITVLVARAMPRKAAPKTSILRIDLEADVCTEKAAEVHGLHLVTLKKSGVPSCILLLVK